MIPSITYIIRYLCNSVARSTELEWMYTFNFLNRFSDGRRRVCVRACVRACMHAYMCVLYLCVMCVCACVCVHVCVYVAVCDLL